VLKVGGDKPELFEPTHPMIGDDCFYGLLGHIALAIAPQCEGDRAAILTLLLAVNQDLIRFRS
jgi:hypothetical protein